MYKKFENNLIQPEIFVKNTEDTKTPINKMSSTLLKSTDNDKAYGQYVHKDSIKYIIPLINLLSN